MNNIEYMRLDEEGDGRWRQLYSLSEIFILKML